MKTPRFASKYLWICLALAAAAVIGVSSYYIDRAWSLQDANISLQAAEAREGYQTAREQVRKYCGTLTGGAKNGCEREVQDSYRDFRHQTRDLEAQRNTAVWTAYMGTAALVGMAFSIIGVGLVFITFRETRAAAQSARDTFDAFVAVERAALVPIPLNGDRTGTHITLGLEISNIGRSSAYIYHVRYGAMPDYHPLSEFKGYARIGQAIKNGETLTLSEALTHPGNTEEMKCIGGYIEYRDRFGEHRKSYFCGDIREQSREEWEYGGQRYRVRPLMPEQYWPDDT